MPDMAAIASAFGALKGMKDIAEAMIGLRDAKILQEKRLEFQTKIIDVQNSILSAQEERASLIDKIRDLEEKIRGFEAWEAQKKRYVLTKLPPGVFVYALKPDIQDGEETHQICQLCYNRGKRSILQQDEPGNGIHHLMCHECGTTLEVGIFIAPPDTDGRFEYDC